MCLADGAAKMSSSRVIKAGSDELQIGGFDFDSVLRDGTPPAPKSLDTSGDFRPLPLFDPSELKGKLQFNLPAAAPEPTASEIASPPQPPANMISEEDLQRYQEESYQRGLQDGKSLAERGLLNVFKSLRTAAEEMLQAREKLLRDSEDDLLQLSMAVARKIINREVAQDRQMVLRLVGLAIENLSEKDELVIRVHPDDHALLTSGMKDQVSRDLAAVSFSFKPDPGIEIGSCQIETQRGTVDAGFEAQLDEVYRRLLDERIDFTPAAEAASDES